MHVARAINQRIYPLENPMSQRYVELQLHLYATKLIGYLLATLDSSFLGIAQLYPRLYYSLFSSPAFLILIRQQ